MADYQGQYTGALVRLGRYYITIKITKMITKKEKVMDMVKTTLNLHTGLNLDDLECLEVWHCYILGNEKWLFAVTYEGLLTDDYFEVTYNKAKDEFYVDRYVKQSNDCFCNI